MALYISIKKKSVINYIFCSSGWWGAWCLKWVSGDLKNGDVGMRHGNKHEDMGMRCKYEGAWWKMRCMGVDGFNEYWEGKLRTWRKEKDPGIGSVMRRERKGGKHGMGLLGVQGIDAGYGDSCRWEWRQVGMVISSLLLRFLWSWKLHWWSYHYFSCGNWMNHFLIRI